MLLPCILPVPKTLWELLGTTVMLRHAGCGAENERHFIMHVLAFFAASDGIVMENLAVRFMSGDCLSLLPHGACAGFHA
jgi:hypothetical protein